MAKVNEVRFVVSSICPPDQVAEGDRIYRSHIDWMKATHQREGPKALLSYDVSKSPELSEPFDLASKPTGNTVFVLTEVYGSDAGGRTFQLGRRGRENAKRPGLVPPR